MAQERRRFNDPRQKSPERHRIGRHCVRLTISFGMSGAASILA
jgi:hypothetical protein